MVSVIILNYNNLNYTINCIRSLYENRKQVELEIIVVDNASTENPDELKNLFSDIKLVKNTTNRGFAAGCNDGIQHSSGDYILLLNNDTVLLNEAVDIVYNFMKNHDEVGISTCRVEDADGTKQNNCGAFPYYWKKYLEKSRLHKLLPKEKRAAILWGNYFSYDKIAYPDWVWGTFFMFRKSLLHYFPQNKLTETFWMYTEDMEWCWIARKAGFKIAFVPEARILHFGGNYSPKVIQMIIENYKLFIRKNIHY